MPDRILVPVDRSERSTEALEYALRAHPNASIVVLHVVSMESLYPSSSYHFQSLIYNEPPENAEDILLEHGTSVVEETLNAVDVSDRDVEWEVVTGDVGDSILKYVDEHDIDAIVIGSHGRSGVSRVLLGSVAEKVTRRSPVPVTVFR